MNGDAIKNALVNNWQTTLLGTAAGVLQTVSTGGFDGNPWSIAAGFLTAFFGVVSKDGNK
jgi:hypothetical protein